MTIPGNVVYIFFDSTLTLTALQVTDAIMYTYHITSFPLYMLTLKDFRKIFISMITLQKMNRQLTN
jgi:hypothetical protein